MSLPRLLRTLFGIYALIIFAISFIVVAPFYFIVFTFVSKKKSPFIAHQYLSRTWAKSLFILFGLRLKVKNKEFIDPKQTYVFIANHRSQLDIPAYAIVTDHTFRFLAKSELTKIPVMGYVIKNLYITVNRKDRVARAKSMEKMIQSLQDEISVFIYPEGTRNKTNEPLLDFRDGAFRLAIESQKPLAIMTIINTANLLSPLRPIELSPGTIECIWSKPISTQGMTMNDVERLKEIAIAEMLEKLNPKT